MHLLPGSVDVLPVAATASLTIANLLLAAWRAMPPPSHNLLTYQSIHSVCLVLLFYSLLYLDLMLIIQD